MHSEHHDQHPAGRTPNGPNRQLFRGRDRQQRRGSPLPRSRPVPPASRSSRYSNAPSVSTTCSRPTSSVTLDTSSVETAVPSSPAAPPAAEPLVTVCPSPPQSVSANVRNLGLEKIANTVRFPCKFNSSGCQQFFYHQEKVEHEEACEFRWVVGRPRLGPLPDHTAVRVPEPRANGREP